MGDSVVVESFNARSSLRSYTVRSSLRRSFAVRSRSLTVRRILAVILLCAFRTLKPSELCVHELLVRGMRC
jgi:hypothetical protein